jgi:hypothetical protein
MAKSRPFDGEGKAMARIQRYGIVLISALAGQAIAAYAGGAHA